MCWWCPRWPSEGRCSSSSWRTSSCRPTSRRGRLPSRPAYSDSAFDPLTADFLYRILGRIKPLFFVRGSSMPKFTAILGAASLAFACTATAVAGDVNLSMGSYSHVIPIEVPAFHGLEPKLALTYSSMGGNGFAGVGWSLAGISTVEWGRTGETQWGGAPDKYFLDGQELVPCQAGSVSPSCTTGGNYSTKIESYLRIKFDSSANTWTVWGRDGTKTTLSPVLTLGPFTVRYGQASTVDTYGNTVNYTWACQSGDCFPDTIT